ncbi:hypothetical protein [Deinococcus sp.]|uniref:hypothetical protein n=1 Tax=Deinococcus sp. TaxID=47478 RepID=UPI003C7B97EC
MSLEPLDHPILGGLVKDSAFAWWLSRIEFMGNNVEFSLQTESQLSTKLLDSAAKFINKLGAEESAYKTRLLKILCVTVAMWQYIKTCT